MFEYPDAYKLQQASQFYKNKSKFDLSLIKKLIIAMESDLEVEPDDSIAVMSLKVPNPKLNVVIIGNETRMAQQILELKNEQLGLTNFEPQQFVIYEQNAPKDSSFNFVYKNFVSYTDSKLQACLKIVECPPDSTKKLVNDTNLNDIALTLIRDADVVLINPAETEREEFSTSVLAKLVMEASKKSAAKLYVLDTPGVVGKFDMCSGDIEEIKQILDKEIDGKIESVQGRVAKDCDIFSHQVKRLLDLNKQRQDVNGQKSNGSTVMTGFLYFVLALTFMSLLVLANNFEYLIEFWANQKTRGENLIGKDYFDMLYGPQLKAYNFIESGFGFIISNTGLEIAIICAILVLLDIICVIIRRQNSQLLQVLTEDQKQRLKDFKIYLDRESSLQKPKTTQKE